MSEFSPGDPFLDCILFNSFIALAETGLWSSASLGIAKLSIWSLFFISLSEVSLWFTGYRTPHPYLFKGVSEVKISCLLTTS